MSITYPTTIDSFTNPQSTDTQSAVSHATQHSNANDAILALETKVGINGSAVTTTHDYKLSGVTGSDKAVSKTGTETLTNKTLTAPVLNVGSDATGDLYYRNASGILTRLPIGTAGQILDVSSGGIPEWIPNPAAENASTTVKGVVQKATTAEINAGTATGSTGAELVVTPDQLLSSNYANAPTQMVKSFVAGESITTGDAVCAGYYQSDGGIVFDNKTYNNTNVSSGGGTQTFSFTVGNNSNRMLIVFVATGASSGTNATPTVTYAGVSMTAGNVQSQSTSQKLHSFYLANPTTGSNNVVVTMGSSSTTVYLSTAVMSYYNVSGIDTSQGTTGSATNLSSSYTVNTIGTLIVSAAGGGGTGTATANCLNNVQHGGSNTQTSIDSGDSGVAITTGTITWNGTLFNLVVVGLLPQTSVSTTTVGIFKASTSTPTNGVNDNRYTKFLGFAKSTVSITQSVDVVIGGIVTGLTSLVAGNTYYIANTPGTIATSAGSNSKKIGISTTSTTLILKDSI